MAVCLVRYVYPSPAVIFAIVITIAAARFVPRVTRGIFPAAPGAVGQAGTLRCVTKGSLVGKRSRRKERGFEKSGTEHAAQASLNRLMAEAEAFSRLSEPDAPPAEVAALIASEFASRASIGSVVASRLRAGVPVADVAEIRRLLLADAGDPPGLAVLSFAAAAAHAAGDEEAEHRYTAQLLAQAQDADGGRPWLDAVRMISGIGHPGEAIELIEPYLRDHPSDRAADSCYSVMLHEANRLADPGDKERAALARFADGSGLAEVKRAVMEFMNRTEWGELVKGKGASTLDLLPGRRLTAPALDVCANLALEAAVKGTDISADGKSPRQLIEMYRAGHQPRTVLTEFAADPGTLGVLARRAIAWAEHAHYGLWQMIYPAPSPGVGCLDVASGTRRYIAFPPGLLDGTPRWTVWLGGVIPVDGIWRATGTGIRLSPMEADAMAETIDKAVEKVIKTTSGGMPLAELLPPEPVPYGQARPWAVQWDYADSPGELYTLTVSSMVMMLAPRLAADVEIHRASPRRDAANPPIAASEAWLDQPHPALRGLTPRAAASGDTLDNMRVEALIRQFEYQAGLAGAFAKPGADLARLRRELGLGADENE